MFDEFMRVTGELPFGELITTCAECYRLCIEGSRSDHQVIRMERPLGGNPEDSRVVAHFVTWWPEKKTTARTYEIALREVEWQGMHALLAVADFWNLTENDHSGFDGAWHTLEAWKDGRSHTVRRWSPSAVPAGELLCVPTGYMQQLAGLAMWECEIELHEVYAPGYIPKRRITSPAKVT